MHGVSSMKWFIVALLTAVALQSIAIRIAITILLVKSPPNLSRLSTRISMTFGNTLRFATGAAIIYVLFLYAVATSRPVAIAMALLIAFPPWLLVTFVIWVPATRDHLPKWFREPIKQPVDPERIGKALAWWVVVELIALPLALVVATIWVWSTAN